MTDKAHAAPPLGPGDLHTLAYRIDPDQLDLLHVYEFGEDFHREWDAIRPRGGPGPQYAHLAQALTITCGQPVLIRPTRTETGFVTQVRMFTTGPIDDWILRTTFGRFQQLARGDDHDAIGQLAVDTKPQAVRLDPHGAHQGVAFEIARWLCARRLADVPFSFDGQAIAYRPDTDGNLVAWDQPIRRETGQRSWLATHYLETQVVTLPGAEHYYFRVEPRLSRMPASWYRVANLWIAHDQHQPLLSVPVMAQRRGDVWRTVYRNHLVEIVQACRLSPMPILPDDRADADSDHFRPKMGTPARHGIGKGVGVRHAFQLHEQIAPHFDHAEPHFTRTSISLGVRRKESRILGADLARTVVASGVDTLRVVCLYANEGTRQRMLTALGWYSTGRDGISALRDDVEVNLADQVTVVCHHAPELLAHGRHRRDLDAVGWLRTDAEPGRELGVVALVETDADAARRPGADSTDDAKPQLRQALAALGVTTQFLDVGSAPAARKDNTDHPAQNAVRDLFSRAGLIDDRLAMATTGLAVTKRPLNRPATLVGIHLREIKGPAGRGTRAKTMTAVKLVALNASPDPEQPWTVTMYDDGLGWTPYRVAAARSFTRAPGSDQLGYYGDGATKLRRYVDQALMALPVHRPLIAFIDSIGARVWPALTHAAHGKNPGLLPGSTSGHPDLAVVRVATGENTIRATHRSHGIVNGDPRRPDLPRSVLYAHTENATSSWLLPQPSRVYQGAQFGARVGAEHTRWNLPPEKDRLMGDDWHLLSATEISVPLSGSWAELELVALTARLCNHPIAWEARTKYPAPLHLARAIDSEHPGNPPDPTR